MERKTIYGLAVAIFVVIIFGSLCAVDYGDLTIGEGIWQILISAIGALWFGNLIRIENAREARRIFSE